MLRIWRIRPTHRLDTGEIHPHTARAPSDSYVFATSCVGKLSLSEHHVWLGYVAPLLGYRGRTAVASESLRGEGVRRGCPGMCWLTPSEGSSILLAFGKPLHFAGRRNETHVSAKQSAARKDAWLPRPHEDQRRTRSFAPSASQGTLSAHTRALLGNARRHGRARQRMISAATMKMRFPPNRPCAGDDLLARCR